MFGSVRLVLASMVLLTHLTGAEAINHFGYYAVRAFFVLSGYCITASLNEQYAFRALPFWANRALKLLPTFYAVSCATAVLITIFPTEASRFLDFWDGGPAWPAALENLLILPQQFKEPHFRFVPPMWSVAVEIIMYFALWAFAARSWQGAAIAMVAGVSYHVACMIDDLPWSLRYFLAPSGLLSFSAGALIYFGRKAGVLHGLSRAAPWAAAGWVANLVVAMYIPGDIYDFGAGYYLNIALFAVIVVKLASMEAAHPLTRIDHSLGELAYPVLVSHWLAAFAVHLLFLPDQVRGPGLALGGAIATLVLAAFLAKLNRMIVEPVRLLVRKNERLPSKPSVVHSTGMVHAA